MTDTGQSDVPVREQLADRIRFDGGVHESDRPTVTGALGHLLDRLESWPASAVTLALHVKDRDNPAMRTTVELDLPRTPTLRASADGELGAALNRIGDVLVSQLNEQRRMSEQRHR